MAVQGGDPQAVVEQHAVAVDARITSYNVCYTKLLRPGIPELLRQKFESTRERFRGVPFLLKRVYVTQHESDIAQDLHELLGEFPELSYNFV